MIAAPPPGNLASFGSDLPRGTAPPPPTVSAGRPGGAAASLPAPLRPASRRPPCRRACWPHRASPPPAPVRRWSAPRLKTNISTRPSNSPTSCCTPLACIPVCIGASESSRPQPAPRPSSSATTARATSHRVSMYPVPPVCFSPIPIWTPASRPSGSAGSTRRRPWLPTPPNALFSIPTSSCTQSPRQPTPAARLCFPPAAPACRTIRTATQRAHRSNPTAPAPELDETRLHRLAVISPPELRASHRRESASNGTSFGRMGGDRRCRRNSTRRRRTPPHRSGTGHPRDPGRPRHRHAHLRRTMVRARRSAPVRQVPLHAARVHRGRAVRRPEHDRLVPSTPQPGPRSRGVVAMAGRQP